MNELLEMQNLNRCYMVVVLEVRAVVEFKDLQVQILIGVVQEADQWGAKSSSTNQKPSLCLRVFW